MTFGSTFGRVFSPTFKPKSQAAASSADTWWDLNGTITSCIAAYQPKGAASLAASKVNLANAGTHDAFAGTDPAFASATGWSFTAASSQYLKTDITPASGYSMIVRYTDKATGNTFACGEYYTANAARFFINPVSGSGIAYGSGSYLTVSPDLASGVIAIAGQQGYRNGTADGSAIGNWTGSTTQQIYIGSLMINGAAGNYATIKIQALAIYSSTLTAQNIADLTTAINLL